MGKIPVEMKFSAALLRYRQLHNTIQRQDGGIQKPIPAKPILPEGRVKILNRYDKHKIFHIIHQHH